MASTSAASVLPVPLAPANSAVMPRPRALDGEAPVVEDAGPVADVVDDLVQVCAAARAGRGRPSVAAGVDALRERLHAAPGSGRQASQRPRPAPSTSFRGSVRTGVHARRADRRGRRGRTGWQGPSWRCARRRVARLDRASHIASCSDVGGPRDVERQDGRAASRPAVADGTTRANAEGRPQSCVRAASRAASGLEPWASRGEDDRLRAASPLDPAGSSPSPSTAAVGSRRPALEHGSWRGASREASRRSSPAACSMGSAPHSSTTAGGPPPGRSPSMGDPMGQPLVRRDDVELRGRPSRWLDIPGEPVIDRVDPDEVVEHPLVNPELAGRQRSCAGSTRRQWRSGAFGARALQGRPAAPQARG